jgi:hypothetical protein
VAPYTYRVIDDDTGIVLDADYEPPPAADWRDIAPLAEGDLIQVIGVERVVVPPIELGVKSGVLRVTTKARFADRQIEAALHRLAVTGDEELVDPKRFYGLSLADLAEIADQVRRRDHVSVQITWQEGDLLHLEPMPHVD